MAVYFHLAENHDEIALPDQPVDFDVFHRLAVGGHLSKKGAEAVQTIPNQRIVLVVLPGRYVVGDLIGLAADQNVVHKPLNDGLVGVGLVYVTFTLSG